MNASLRLPAPLRAAADFSSTWSDTNLDFDSAANLFVARHRSDGEARDLPVLDLRTWAVKDDKGYLALAPLAGHEPAHRLRGAALSGLAARLGAPADFIRDRLPAPLQLATLNVLLASEARPMSATLRLRGDEVGALVSQRYAPLDPVELVETVRGALGAAGVLGEVRVRSVATGLADVLRLTFPATQKALQVGDVTAVGLDISSSCFGRSALHVRTMLWRLVCTNGLRSAEPAGSVSFRHVGDPARLRDGLRDAVPSLLVHGSGLLQQWHRALGVHVENLSDALNELRELSIGERARVEESIAAEAGTPQLPERLDLYRVVNGITAAAHWSEPARRLELEGFAGEFLRRHVR